MVAEETDPVGDEANGQTRSIQRFISQHYYTCTDERFAQIGRAYGCGGDFTLNVKAVAGEGAAEFAAKAVAACVA